MEENVIEQQETNAVDTIETVEWQDVNATTCDESDKPKDCVKLKYFKRGRDHFIRARAGVEVYDTSSKRRIGKEEGKSNIMKVFLFDRVVMKGDIYLLQAFDTEDQCVILKKIKPVEN